MIIKTVQYKTIKSKLKKSYNLSYGSLDFYESIITSIKLNNRITLYGEVTPLKDYTDETIESIKQNLDKIVSSSLNKNVDEFISLLEVQSKRDNSFVLSSLIPPLEVYANDYKLGEVKTKDLIYSFDIKNKNISQIEKELNEIRLKGFNTLKIKLGKEIGSDIETIETLSSFNLKDFKLRFDANCGYTFEQSITILDLLSTKLKENTEYLEQPMSKTCWLEMKKINDLNLDIPVMLDESIYTISDIKKAKEIGTNFIKLKLCKFGSLGRLQKAVDLAKQLNLNVVLGNGVATDISNYYELIFYYNNNLFGAAESVGFLKLKKPIKFDIKLD